MGAGYGFGFGFMSAVCGGELNANVGTLGHPYVYMCNRILIRTHVWTQVKSQSGGIGGIGDMYTCMRAARF